MNREAVTTRTLVGEDGSDWVAFADDAIVAHGRPGAILAFRKADGADEVLNSNVRFNSMAAADFALRTMAGKELERRLRLARQAAAGL